MRAIQLHESQQALQLAVAINGEDPPTRVMIGLEKAPGGAPDPHWLLYVADAAMAREIAADLIVAAQMLEGTLSAEDVQTDTEGFCEHG